MNENLRTSQTGVVSLWLLIILISPGLAAAQGKKGSSGCQIGFSVVFDDTQTGLMSDEGGAYIDGVQKVVAFTGSHPGFRLDTNGSIKLEGAGGVRCLNIDLGTAAGRPFDKACKGIDMRFELHNNSLDLCSLKNVGDTGTVGLMVSFEVLGKWDDRMTLTYGTDSYAERVLVTRTGTHKWTIEGTRAALRDGGIRGTVVDPNVQVPFKMTITDKNAPAP